MKIFIPLFISMLIINVAFSQEKKEQKTKMLNFVSKTGVIIKFEDYNLPNIKTKLYTVVELKIRKIISGNEERLFFQISKTGKYDTKTASIVYEDLLEIQKVWEKGKKIRDKNPNTYRKDELGNEIYRHSLW